MPENLPELQRTRMRLSRRRLKKARGGVTLCPLCREISEAVEVRQARSDGLHLLEPIEEQGRRVPLSAHERIAERGRQRRGHAQRPGGHHAGFHVGFDHRFGCPFHERLELVDDVVAGDEAGDAQDGGVLSSCTRDSARSLMRFWR